MSFRTKPLTSSKPKYLEIGCELYMKIRKERVYQGTPSECAIVAVGKHNPSKLPSER